MRAASAAASPCSCEACRKRFRRGSRAGTPRERSQRVWRRARSLARKCRSHCRRDVRDSLHSPWQEDQNRWPGTRSAYRPRRKARHEARARSRPPGHVDFSRRELTIVFLVAFDVRCLDIVECEIPAFLIAEFGHSPEEICIMWGISGLHTDKADTASLAVAAHAPRAATPPRRRAAR